MKASVRLFGAVVAIATGLALSTPASADVQILPLKTDTYTYSRAELGKEGRKLFDGFKRSSAFHGAFFYNAKEDIAWYLTGTGSLDVAIAVARRECERFSARPAGCTLYALQLPEGMSPQSRKGGALSEGGMTAYRRHYLPQARKWGYAAFVTSGLGVTGYGYGYNSAADAIERAMLECKAQALDFLQTFEPEARQHIRKIGADVCRVIEKRGP